MCMRVYMHVHAHWQTCVYMYVSPHFIAVSLGGGVEGKKDTAENQRKPMRKQREGEQFWKQLVVFIR